MTYIVFENIKVRFEKLICSSKVINRPNPNLVSINRGDLFNLVYFSGPFSLYY